MIISGEYKTCVNLLFFSIQNCIFFSHLEYLLEHIQFYDNNTFVANTEAVLTSSNLYLCSSIVAAILRSKCSTYIFVSNIFLCIIPQPVLQNLQFNLNIKHVMYLLINITIRIVCEREEKVINHIKTFRVIESHYVRKEALNYILSAKRLCATSLFFLFF